MAIYLVALLIGTLFLYSIFVCYSATIAYAVLDKVHIIYVYDNEEISATDVQRGEPITKTLDYDIYQEEVNLPPNYVLEWHIGSESGEIWTKEYLFNVDTNLFGVAVLNSEIPKGDDNETPIDNNETPTESNEPINEAGGGETNNTNKNTDSDIIKTGQENTSIKTYSIVVESDNDKYTVSGNPQKDEKITVVFKEYKEGYEIKNITVLCEGSPVVFSQKGKEISFYMPEGDVNISCVYEIIQENKSGILNTQEIIALSVVGGIAVISGTFFIIKGKLSKKKTVKKEKNKPNKHE